MRLSEGKNSSAVGTFGSRADSTQVLGFESRGEDPRQANFEWRCHQSEPWGRLSTDDWHYVVLGGGLLGFASFVLVCESKPVEGDLFCYTLANVQ